VREVSIAGKTRWRAVQWLAPALQQVLDLEPIRGAIGLQRHGDRVFRGEHARFLLADLHCSRFSQRLADQGRRSGEELHREALDQDGIALCLKTKSMQFLVELVEQNEPPPTSAAPRTRRDRAWRWAPRRK